MNENQNRLVLDLDYNLYYYKQHEQLYDSMNHDYDAMFHDMTDNLQGIVVRLHLSVKQTLKQTPSYHSPGSRCCAHLNNL